ncbi:MAG: prenyltransferase [Rhodocyclaceae bacterium]|nr:prenyltransferase [Rhodocyclaceae bacterium]
MSEARRLARPAEPQPQDFGSSPRRWFAATRPAFLTITLVGCLIGLATAHRAGVRLDPLTAALTILLALLVHAGANVVNDVCDADNGSDDANLSRLYPFTGGSRMIQNGVLGRDQAARFGGALLLAVIPAGLWLVWHSGAGLLAIGAAGLVVAWTYSAPPLRLMSRGLGELAIVAGWLLVVVGADYVQRGGFAGLPTVAGLSFAMLVAALLYINQFPDHDADAAAGKRTLVVRLGTGNARWGYLLLVLAAYGWLILQVGRGALPQASAAAAFTALLSLPAGRTLLSHADTPAELVPAIRQTILAAHIHGLLLAGTIAFGHAGELYPQ